MRVLILAASLSAVAARSGVPLQGPPPVNSYVSFWPVKSPGSALRHCDFVTSTCPLESGNDDFVFKIVPALNKAAAPYYSLQSTNYPGP